MHNHQHESHSMEIDLYNLCPVHPEKKIKFCCGKEIVAELNQVVTKYQAKQMVAALEALNRLIERVGPKDCLQSFKVKLLAAMGDFEHASETNDEFLSANPNHSLGLEQQAILLANQGKVIEAFEALQDAMDNLPGAQIPVGFATAFVSIAGGLMPMRMVWAARAHAMFANILNREDEMTHRVLNWIDGHCNMIFLRRSNQLLPAPAGETPWKKKFENAVKASRRGQLRKAVQLLRKALEVEPKSSFLLQNLALALCALPDRTELIKAWRKVAELDDLLLVRRIEAEAIAQYFSELDEIPGIDIESITFEFDRPFDEVHAAALSSKRLVMEELEPEQDETNGPPPRAAFMFLDRDRIETTQGLSPEELPRVLGKCWLFGKQTDCRARFELVTRHRESFESDLQQFNAIFGNCLEQVSVEKAGTVSTTIDQLQVSWYLPPTTSRDEFSRLEKEFQFHVVEKILPDLALDFMEGKTLRQLVQSPQGQVQAHAVIAKTALGLDGRPWLDQWFSAVNRVLGLSPIPTTQYKSIEEIQSPFELLYADIANFEQNDLEMAFMLAASVQNNALTRRVGELLLERNTFDGRLWPEMVHMSIGQLELDDAECLRHFSMAKASAKAAGRPFGQILVAEFEQRLLRGQVNGLRSLFMDLQRNHLKEPGLAERMGMMLSKYGLITPDGRVMLPPENESPAQTKSGLWTPDGAAGAEPTAASAGAKESKLWIPGQ